MADKALAQERLFALRETITRMEGKPLHRLSARQESRFSDHGSDHGTEQGSAFLPFGISPLDAVLDGGLPRAGMAEIRSAELRNAGAATGFALSLCAFLMADGEDNAGAASGVLWVGERNVAREAGEPFSPGLQDHGIVLERLVYALPRKLEEALWLAEAGLTSKAFRAVILEIAGNPKRFGLSESRRLSLRARHAGSLLLLLRQGGGEEAGSTLFRMSASSAPSGFYRLPDGSVLSGTIGTSVFSIGIEKSPKPAFSPLSQTMTIEWNAHERHFLEPKLRVPVSRQPAATAHSGADLSPSPHGPDRKASLGSVVAFSRAS